MIFTPEADERNWVNCDFDSQPLTGPGEGEVWERGIFRRCEGEGNFGRRGLVGVATACGQACQHPVLQLGRAWGRGAINQTNKSIQLLCICWHAFLKVDSDVKEMEEVEGGSFDALLSTLEDSVYWGLTIQYICVFYVVNWGEVYFPRSRVVTISLI